MRLDDFKQGLSAADYGAIVERMEPGQDRVIIAAARGEEVSWVLGHDDNSLFTKHLLAGLRGQAVASRPEGIG
jgi:hypothetical protein